MIVLAGDVGGTNTRLAIVELNGRGARIARKSRYPSRDYPGLTPIVDRFCEEVVNRPDRASGAGMVSAYRYLLASAIAPQQATVRAQMEKEDPATVITRHGLARTDFALLRAGSERSEGPEKWWTTGLRVTPVERI